MSRLDKLRWALPLVLAGASMAEAQVCAPSDLQANLQYLRRLSLDLRGRLPDAAELESVVTNGVVDPAIPAAMVRSADGLASARAFHRALLWLNVSDQRIANQNWRLVPRRNADGTNSDIFTMNSTGRNTAYRGNAAATCLDEPARFDASGAILTTPDANNANIRREGWVQVAPYWDPTTTVKVCAFDAQTRATGTLRGRPANCARTLAPDCGCGPEMRWCHSSTARTEATIISAINEQSLRFVESVVGGGRPYTDLLTARDMEVNGPIVHYLRYLSENGQAQLYAVPDIGATLPNVPYTDASWQTIQRAPLHSGILTLPAYLIKFMSDRGRANRFYNAFLCSHFEAPPGGLPAADDPCNGEPDLTKRCGCRYCHIAVEPAAAHWGRFSEAGIAMLAPADFPSYRAECAASNANSNALCRRFYFTDPGSPQEEAFKGWLRSYVFADPTRQANIEAGPAAIAASAIQSGAFARCAVKQAWERLLARETVDEDGEAIDALTRAFQASAHDYRALLEAIVKRAEYAQAGQFDGKVGAP